MSKIPIECARELVQKYNTRDPFELCSELGIEVRFKDIGSLRGFYTVIKGERFIVISEALSESEARSVCAHELGHDRLHRELALDSGLRDIFLFQMNPKCEYESNRFAAELLLDEGELDELVALEYGIPQIAQCMGVYEDLVRLKLSAKYGETVKDGYDPAFLKK